MTSTGSLKVLVDNNSPAIQYVGDWTAAPPRDDMKNLTLFNGNLPFSDKLHGAAEGKTASLLYKFTGVTGLRLYATIDVPRPPGVVLGGDAAWANQCSVDPVGPQVAVESIVLQAGQENDYMLCDIRNLSPTETYTFNYTITVVRGQPIWFDRLVLDPSANANLENALIEMDHRYLGIQYDKDWSNVNNAAHITTTPQSKMSLDFTGTSVSWYSAWMKQWSMMGTEAAWKIDDKPFQRFTIPTIDPKYSDYFIQDLLFKTPDLEPGHHRLEVTYVGESDPSDTRPLALHNLVIQNAPVPTGSPSPSATSSAGTGAGDSPTHISEPTASGFSRGAKIGVVVGVSIAGLMLIASIVFFLLGRKRRAAAVNNTVTLQRSDTSSHEEKA